MEEAVKKAILGDEMREIASHKEFVQRLTTLLTGEVREVDDETKRLANIRREEGERPRLRVAVALGLVPPAFVIPGDGITAEDVLALRIREHFTGEPWEEARASLEMGAPRLEAQHAAEDQPGDEAWKGIPIVPQGAIVERHGIPMRLLANTPVECDTLAACVSFEEFEEKFGGDPIGEGNEQPGATGEPGGVDLLVGTDATVEADKTDNLSEVSDEANAPPTPEAESVQTPAPEGSQAEQEQPA